MVSEQFMRTIVGENITMEVVLINCCGGWVNDDRISILKVNLNNKSGVIYLFSYSFI